MIASSSNPPPPPPGMGNKGTMIAGPPGGAGAKATMVASQPPPTPIGGGGGGTVVAPPQEAVAAGGTMIASGDAVPVAVAVAPSVPQAPIDLVGQLLLGRYKVVKKLGEGGMGTVYLGEHATIGKKVAIKVLSHEFAHKEDLRQRFLGEARAASMVSQENVVEIHDFGDTPDGSVFFIMEFLKGEDLSDTVKNMGRIPWPRAKPIMLQVCRALAAAHDAGIIHRDMKPENCYRIKRGKNEDFIKVLDFGIAKVTSDEDGEGKGLTKTGMIFGTPEYMSPEQAQGAKPDYRVDVYACGVILYELLTGRVPFTADTFMGILTKHMFEVPEAPSSVVPDADIPPEVEAIILKAMQKDRELRFDDMRAMAAAIEAVGTGAAAVGVVNENISRPSTGQMAFTGTQAPGTVPPVAAGAYPEEQRSNKGLILGLVGALALVAAGVGAFMAFGGKGDKPAGEQQPAAVAKAPDKAAEEPETPEVEEPETVKQIAAGTETVNYHITTTDSEGNLVEASIVDPRDHGSYGKTNTEEGVEVEKSDKPVALTLKASGFEPYAIEIIPAADKTFEYELVPKAKAPVKTTKKPTKKKTKKTTVDPKPEDPKPDETKTKKKKPPRRVSPDLKDPFGRKGG